ncbi:hypothetical protein Q426_06940 [Streptococcus equi subsp. zooepidemicus CY]|uniref:Uncharacterized protein n=1 Tax=Streptococcus equi subsp. ruminatorum CECT 5772 TaxID=1051981 RepID=A0A922NUQ1_9STRE|nr:hypothetical protein Q426_06940 [Streptococcus equi subsp. zooepidemicus CY]KED04727.1 hypothetical protein CECT5772_03871 [Streptococcus equi subsp. ruminatorum CECT 5772]
MKSRLIQSASSVFFYCSAKCKDLLPSAQQQAASHRLACSRTSTSSIIF